ncbi:MAG: recombinase family protein [Bacteroidetes bacterium]|nr:recombinase family protein [Bacteroidota bacterium]
MDTNQSLEWQKKYCDEYAIKNKLNIKGCFGGTYESAKSDERKEFNRMLKFVKAVKQNKEKIAYILVYSLDRFSRTGDSAIYIAGELKKVGVNILAVTQPIDTNSHAGALQQNIQFIFSKYDNDLRRQKTVDGMREKLRRGEWIGHAPKGYSFVKGAEKQTIIVNEQGELIRQAFEWRANGMTYDQIVLKLASYGMKMPKQTLTDTFRNPFYCGYISHSFLNGELVKGKHPALISEELFFRANALKKTEGFKCNLVNDNLPLKIFLKDVETGAPFTGYLVRKKGLYYYKVNKIGIKVNRSVKMMHEKFRELLAYYTINSNHLEPLKIQLQYTWDNLTETNTGEKKGLSLQLNSSQDEFRILRKRHALGEVGLDVYQEFKTEMETKIKSISEKLEELEQNLSNPQDLINYTCKLASNLVKVWDLGDFYQKQIFQNTLFPTGLGYDSKNEQYRTTEINSVFDLIASVSSHLTGLKNGTSRGGSEKSRFVPGTGLEPVRP